MPPRWGGAAKCSMCAQSVYFAEQAIGPAGRIYHKLCLKCSQCGRMLDATTLVDHDGDPYCKACYAKTFGPKGYGAGGALVGEYHERSTPGRSSPVSTPPPPIYNGSAAASAAQSASRAAQLGTGAAPSSPLAHAQPPRSLPASPAGTGTSSANACPRCGKAVYFAEQVLALGKKWHKLCLRCAICSTSLQPNTLNEREDQPLCKKCYSAHFGTSAAGLITIRDQPCISRH